MQRTERSIASSMTRSATGVRGSHSGSPSASGRGPGVDKAFADLVRCSRAARAEAAGLQARAAAAGAEAVAAVSSVAARHGHRLRGQRVILESGACLAVGQVISGVFTVAGVAGMRRLAMQVGRSAGVAEPVLANFGLAVQELLTNAVRHGGGWGRIRLYRDGDLLVCIVTDRGPGFIGDPTQFGTLPPDHSEGGRGMWLAQRLADSFSISTGPAGASITVTMNLRARVSRPLTDSNA